MSDQRVEIKYKVTTEGAPELNNLAAAQRAVKQGVKENNDLLKEQGDVLERTGAKADAYAAKQERLRRAAFKRGETYDPELIEEARIKTLGRAHDQLNQSIEQGQLKQLRGYERLRAERDIQLRDLSSLKDASLFAKVDQSFVQQVNALRTAQNAARAKAAASAVPQEFSLGARQVGQISRNPGSGIAGLADGAAESLGPAATAAGAIVVALVAAAAAGLTLVKESAEWAQNTHNTATRLGLTATEMVQLSGAAGIVGVNVKALEGSTRILSQALEDPAGGGKKVIAELQKLGVAAFDSKGQVREFGPVLLDFIGKLGGISSTTERFAAATRVLGRGSKELQPYLADVERLNQLAKDLGLSIEGPLVDSLSKSQQEFNKLSLVYERLKLQLAGKIAPIVIPIVTTLTEAANGAGAGSAALVGAAFVTGGPVAAYNAIKLLATKSKLDEQNNKPTLQVGDGHVLNRPEDEAAAAAARRQFGNTEEGLEARKGELKKSIDTAQVKLGSPDVGPAAREQIAAQQKTDQSDLRQVEQRLKDLHKAQGEYDRLKTQVESANKQADQFDLTGIEKIRAKYKELTDEIRAAAKDHSITKGQADQLINGPKGTNAAEQKELEADASKQNVARIKEELSVTEQLIKLRSRPGSELDTIDQESNAARANALKAFQAGQGTDETEKALSEANKKRDTSRNEFFAKEKEATRQQQRSLAELNISGPASRAEKERAFNPFGVFNQGDEEARAKDISAIRQREIAEQAKVESVYVGQTAADRNAELKTAEEASRLDSQLVDIRLQGESKILQLRLEQTRTNAGQAAGLAALQNPNNELAVAQRVHDIKQQALIEELAQTHDLEAFKKGSQELEYERISKILELQNEQAEHFKSTVTEGVLALQSGGTTALGNFAQSQAKGLEAKLIGNAAGVVFDTVKNSIPVVGGQHQVDANGKPVTDANGVQQLTFLGKLLQGTPFAAKADPATLAQAANTTSTTLNTAATDALTQALTYLGTGGTAGALPGGAQTPTLGSGGLPGLGGLGGGDIPTVSLDSPSIQAITSPAVFGGEEGGAAPSDAANFSTTVTGTASQGGFLSTLGFLGKGASTIASGDAFGTLFHGDPNLPAGSTANTATQVGAGIGIAGAVYTGVSTAVKDFSKGGASGIAGGIGSVLGTAAALDPEPISKAILGTGALVAGLVKSFLGDPRANREKQETQELQAAHYVAPNSINVTETTEGNQAFTNARGGLSIQKGAPLVELYNQILGFDPLHPDTHLLTATNQRLGAGTQALPSDLNPKALSAGAAGTTNIYVSASVPVSAIDSKSFLDHSDSIGDAMSKALQSTHRVGSDIRRMVNPQ